MDLKSATGTCLYIHAHPGWYARMCARRAPLHLWTGYWSFSKDYLAEEPLDPPNIFLASLTTLLAMLGILYAWRQYPDEAIRYAGVLSALSGHVLLHPPSGLPHEAH